ncbi:MAG: sulfotransferase domain-containing protein [Proteobacteria bacterium]|nr:sulfotransferase domain-containing protein [Pseudomonadota bacterium]
MTKIPSVIIAGMPRGGTTYMYNSFMMHPSIYVAHRKELAFFIESYFRNIKSDEWYLGHFSSCKESEVPVDISPPCFFDLRSPQRILEFNPDARIILSIRKPSEYVVSIYHQQRKRGNYFSCSFEEFINGKFINTDFEWNLRYRFDNEAICDNIKNYIDTFEDRVLLSDFSHFRHSPLEVLKAFESFIGVPSSFREDNYIKQKVNSSTDNSNHFLHNIIFSNLSVKICRALPEKLVKGGRRKYDKIMASTDSNDTKYWDESEEKLAAEKMREQDAWVETLFEDSPFILGNMKPFRS